MGVKDARDAVVELLDEHRNMLEAFIFSLTGNWTLTEEAVQETNLWIVENHERFELGTHFGAWSRTVARHRMQEVIHREKRQQVIAKGLAEALQESDWRGDEGASIHHEKLQRCMDALPEGMRQCLKAKAEEKQSGEALAHRFGKSLEAIYQILSRARRRVRACMKKGS